jgi:hypothetical protein
VQRVNSNTYYEFLLTPSGISAPIIQNIGTARTNWVGMANFSPDGTRYATFHAEYTAIGGLDIYDFDRCSGILSNSIHIPIPQSTSYSGGMAFSADSRFLYLANIDSVYQFDITSANIAASKIVVAAWDSFYSPNPPFSTRFDVMQLAPDGKIYITTGNSTFHIHVINNPDSLGLACDLAQHLIQFQYWYCNGIPNHPNYFLGCDTTGGCFCLVGENEIKNNLISARASPNPNNGIFTLQFNVQKISGELKVYDVIGKEVLKDYVAPWSQFKRVDISSLPRGIYLCRMKWSNGEASVKVVKE